MKNLLPVTRFVFSLGVFFSLKKKIDQKEQRSEADHLLPEEHSQVISRYEEPLEDHIDPSSLENMVPIARFVIFILNSIRHGLKNEISHSFVCRGSFAMIYKAQWCGITVAVKRLPFSPPLSQNRVYSLFSFFFCLVFMFNNTHYLMLCLLIDESNSWQT